LIVRCSSYHPAAATQRRRPSLQAFAVAISSADSSTNTRPPEFANPTAYAEALAAHRQVIREACDRHDGVEVDTQGDAFFSHSRQRLPLSPPPPN
ncbi:MAG TPA: hypothetical protein VGQ15_13985, partial [Gaiellaceae bacterium]|nr:hypothetical protein [Gaiellaceae bacterium]